MTRDLWKKTLRHDGFTDPEGYQMADHKREIYLEFFLHSRVLVHP